MIETYFKIWYNIDGEVYNVLVTQGGILVVEGLIMIFIIFIAFQILFFDKEKYKKLWINLHVAALIFCLSLSPFVSFGILFLDFDDVGTPWLFHFFSIVSMIIAFFYIRSKIRDRIETKRMEERHKVIWENYYKEQEAKQAEENHMSNENTETHEGQDG